MSKKSTKKAEEYYLRAIESGDNKTLNNLGIYIKKQKEKNYYLEKNK